MDSSGIYTTIELLVEQSFANEIKRKGLAELAFRRTDQKFRSLVKCRLVNDNSSSEVAEKILDAALRSDSSRNQAVSKLAHHLHNMDLSKKKLPALDVSVKDILKKTNFSFDLSKSVQALPFVEIALSLVNIGVSVAGFYLIGEKLKGITGEIKSIKSQIEGLQDLNYESEIYKPADELLISYNYIRDKLVAHEPVTREELQNYLKTMSPYISMIIRLIKKQIISTESLLNILFLLLPAYTSILSMYLKAFYFDTHHTPANYERFLEVYQEINSEEFRKIVQDHYFLDEEYSYKETNEILNTQLLFVFSERLEIEDMMSLVEIFNNDEDYQAFEAQLNKLAEQLLESSIEDISEKSGIEIDDCRRILAVAQ